MKTLIIYDTCGESDLKFALVDGILAHSFNGRYIGLWKEGETAEEGEKADEDLSSFISKIEHLFSKEFPKEFVNGRDKIAVIGWIP